MFSLCKNYIKAIQDYSIGKTSQLTNAKYPEVYATLRCVEVVNQGSVSVCVCYVCCTLFSFSLVAVKFYGLGPRRVETLDLPLLMTAHSRSRKS